MKEETRVLITGDHPWKGHTGTFKGESLSLLGKQMIAEAEKEVESNAE